jgi:two-component system sensor histidine kinase KdpD
VRPERTRDLFIPEQRHQFEIFAALVATALERVHYVDVARDALLMAGLQSGEVKLEIARQPLKQLVDDALKSLGSVMAKFHIINDIPADLPPITGDTAMIQRVIRSLIGNVAKHTPAGTHVTLSAQRRGDSIEVAVEDDGPGVPKGREEEIFESFARGEQQTSRRGAGLGLAISRAIINAHGGSIHAESGRERGTRVAFTLPLNPPSR